jgi:phenylalanyl-tRNA synthetase alpha subunit
LKNKIKNLIEKTETLNEEKQFKFEKYHWTNIKNCNIWYETSISNINLEHVEIVLIFVVILFKVLIQEHVETFLINFDHFVDLNETFWILFIIISLKK